MRAFRSEWPLFLLVATLCTAGVTTFGAQSAQRPERPPVQGNGTVRGRVVASETGAALHRAYVRLKPRQGDELGAVTNEEGRFEFTKLPPARYVLSASKGGRVTRQFGQRPDEAEGSELEVANGQVIDGIALSLPPGAVIDGRFVDEAGRPMVGVRVAALKKRFSNGAMQLADE